MAHDTPEPCKFLSPDINRRWILWTHKVVGHASHPSTSLVLLIGDVEKFPQAFVHPASPLPITVSSTLQDILKDGRAEGVTVCEVCAVERPLKEKKKKERKKERKQDRKTRMRGDHGPCRH